MRVISGSARGTKLESRESISTRPTLDRIKENMFNIIQDKVNSDTICLDLFAGSGQLGIETLSRGAQKCYFCDKDKEDLIYLKKNITKTRFWDKSIIYNTDFKVALNKINETVDIIFLDPPYASDFIYEAMKIIIEKNILSENGIIILETDEAQKIKVQLEKLKIEKYKFKNYGRVSIFIVEF